MIDIMKILVTGGAGFIGSHLVDHLLQQNHNLALIDNFDDFYSPEEKRANINQSVQNNKVKLFEDDIRDYTFLEQAFSLFKPEVVIHLAAKAGVRPSIENPLLYEEVNIKGTLNILEMCRQFGVARLIFASSSSVYGNSTRIPFSESDPVDRPISPYAATKKAGELLCYTYHQLYQLPVVCLRFFTVYGPRQRPDLAIRKFMELIEAGQEIPVYGDGSMSRDFTYIDDIIAGVVASITKNVAYEIINLGNASPISVLELIAEIEKVLAKQAVIKHLPEQLGDVKQTFADTTKAERLLGFSPHTPISQGLSEMVRWLRNR